MDSTSYPAPSIKFINLVAFIGPMDVFLVLCLLLRYNAEQGGPYVLIETDAAEILSAKAFSGATTYIGPVLQEVEARYDLGGNSTGELVAITRVFGDNDKERASVVEIEHGVPAKIGENTELIMHVSTSLNTNGSIWTDESGLEMHERKFEPTLPISGNYHVREQYQASMYCCIPMKRVLFCALHFLLLVLGAA